MNEKRTRIIASIGLLVGGIFGMVGSFASSTTVRGIAWGVDGVGLILASALLTLYFFRKGYDAIAAGFLILAIGEGLILSCSAINLNEDISSFGAGTSLWAASLALISFQRVFPLLVRVTGFIAAVLFIVVSVQIFAGRLLHALTEPLPFYAYPFFA